MPSFEVQFTRHDDQGQLVSYDSTVGGGYCCDKECLGILLASNGLPVSVVVDPYGHSPMGTHLELVNGDSVVLGTHRPEDYQLIDDGRLTSGTCSAAELGPDDGPLEGMPECPTHLGAVWSLGSGPDSGAPEPCAGPCHQTIEPDGYCGCLECDCDLCHPDGPPGCDYSGCSTCNPENGEGEEASGDIAGSLTAAIPALNLYCPRPCDCGGSDALSSIIVHLNDSEAHRDDWPREAVADWLAGPPIDNDGVPMDLTFKTPGVDPCPNRGVWHAEVYRCGTDSYGPGSHGGESIVNIPCHNRWAHDGPCCYRPDCPARWAEEIDAALAAPPEEEAGAA